MFLSKIWFILIALASAVAISFALIAPRPFERRLGALEGQRLDRAQYAAEQMFKVDAHKWIDHVGKLGRDAIIAESLDAASRGSGEYNVIHRTIQDRFRTLIPDLASGGIDSIVAIDTKGRVIARVGDNEKEHGDFIGGAEIIADALRGYLSDDVWGVNGRLQRLAAAPVLSKNRDRIVGAVYVERRDRPGAGRAPEEEPRRRHRPLAAREGDRLVAPAGPAGCAARADRAPHEGDRGRKAHPAHPDDGGQGRADRGRGAVSGPGGRAAGLLRPGGPAPRRQRFHRPGSERDVR